MKADTRQVLTIVLNADETIDRRVIDAVMSLLERFDNRTDADFAEDVKRHLFSFMSTGSRTQTEILDECNSHYRILPSRSFNPIALEVANEIITNHEKYGIACTGKKGCLRYHYRPEKK